MGVRLFSLKRWLPLFACLIAFGLRIALGDLFYAEASFPLYYVAVVVSVWNCGFRAGLWVTGLAALFDAFISWRSEQGFHAHEAIGLTAFVINALFVATSIQILSTALERETRAKTKAVSNEAMFRLLAESIRDHAIIVIDRKNRCIDYVSESFERIFGLPKEELYRERFAFLKVVHPDDRVLIEQNIRRLADGRYERCEYRLLKSDGSIRWIRDNLLPMFDNQGVETKLVWTAEDITREREIADERQRAHDSLTESERKYRMLFTLNPVPMLIYENQTYRIIDANEAAIELGGFSLAEVQKVQINTFIGEEDFKRAQQGRFEQNDREITRHREPFKIRRKDGRVLDVEVAACTLNWAGRSNRLLVLKDITEQLKVAVQLKAAMEAADRAKSFAESANEAKTRFLAFMSHEIRTPLGAMLGFAELMQDPRQSTSDRLDCIRTILRNGDELSRVINDILDLSKIESEKLEIEHMVFSPLHLIEDVVGLLSLGAESKGLAIEVETEGNLPPFAFSDPTRLRQVLLNLLGNAIKFSDSGKVRIVAKSARRGERDSIEFKISDTGPGVPADYQKHLFDPFTQADSSMTRRHGGTGLGLALSKRLVKALGGDLYLSESEPGEGATFAFWVDIGKLSEISETDSESSRATKAKSHEEVKTVLDDEIPDFKEHEMRILLVEDAPDNRVLMSRLIKATGANVTIAEDGARGVEIALQGDFDLILMDIQMPLMDGYQAVEYLRHADYRKPVVALTAHAMKGDREKCLQAGFDEHLVKPLNRIALYNILKRYAPETELALKATPSLAPETLTLH